MSGTVCFCSRRAATRTFLADLVVCYWDAIGEVRRLYLSDASLQVLGCVLQNHPATTQNHRSVGDGQRLADVLFDQNHTKAAVGSLTHGLHEPLDEDRRQA